MDQPTLEFVDAQFWERIRRADSVSPDERLLEGPRLFDLAAEWARAGIRCQHPDADEAEVASRFRARLELARRLESAA